jgi:hypothetical protein
MERVGGRVCHKVAGSVAPLQVRLRRDALNHARKRQAHADELGQRVHVSDALLGEGPEWEGAHEMESAVVVVRCTCGDERRQDAFVRRARRSGLGLCLRVACEQPRREAAARDPSAIRAGIEECDDHLVVALLRRKRERRPCTP